MYVFNIYYYLINSQYLLESKSFTIMTNLMNINDLSEQSGIRPRTIRSYIQQGIIPAPTELGRYAKYSKDEHLLPLLVASDLRNNQRWALDEIRSFLMSCSKDEIETLAQNVSTNLSRSINTSKSSKNKSALEYLQNLSRKDKNLDYQETFNKKDPDVSALNINDKDIESRYKTFYNKVPEISNFREQHSEIPDSSTFSRTPIEELGHKLSSLIEDKKYITRKASLQNWKKVEVTPEIEINIRMERDLSDREKNAIEQIADYLREIITRR